MLVLNLLFYGFYCINELFKKNNSDGYAYMIMSGLMGLNVVALSTYVELFVDNNLHLSSYYLLFFFLFLFINYFLFLRNDKYRSVTENRYYIEKKKLCIFLAVLYAVLSLSFLVLGGYLFRLLVLGIE
jgi:CDP-diglyceride synthetase